MEKFLKSKLNVIMIIFGGLSFIFLLLQRISYIFLSISIFFLSGIVFIIALKLNLKFIELKRQKLNTEHLTPFETKMATRRKKNELLGLFIEFSCFYIVFLALFWLNFTTYIL